MTQSTTLESRATAVGIPFAAIVLAMLPAVLDQTILATALPVIASDLGSLTDLSWVVTAYVVAAAATTPLWGKLGDRHGHRRLLQVALTVFVASSALCGAAQDIPQLALLRAVQGAAAGGLMTLAMAAVGDLVAPRERGALPGVHRRHLRRRDDRRSAAGRRPRAARRLAVGVLREPAGRRAGPGRAHPAPAGAGAGRAGDPLDAGGAALLAGATAAFMLVCIWGGQRYAWSSAEIAGLAAAAAVLAGALVAHERRAPDPIVPFHLLRTRVVAVASAALFLGTAALFAVTVFVPVFLERATGASPTEAGLLLAPAMLGITVSTTLSGRSISRTGRYKRFPIAGLAGMAAGLVLLAALAGEQSQLATGVGLAVFGLGFGMVTQVLIVAVHNSVDRRELGIATAVTGFFRALGGAVGAAVLGAVFAAQAGSGVVDGARSVFVVAAPLAMLALLAVCFLPEKPLEREH